jgi:hypothetical protein
VVTSVLVGIHLVLGIVILAVVAAVVVIAFPAAVRRRPPPRPYRPLQRAAAGLVLAEVGIGGLLLVTGRRPASDIHFIYALAVVLVMPVAYALAGRDRGHARLYHVGGSLLLLGVVLRLITTG